MNDSKSSGEDQTTEAESRQRIAQNEVTRVDQMTASFEDFGIFEDALMASIARLETVTADLVGIAPDPIVGVVSPAIARSTPSDRISGAAKSLAKAVVGERVAHQYRAFVALTRETLQFNRNVATRVRGIEARLDAIEARIANSALDEASD